MHKIPRLEKKTEKRLRAEDFKGPSSSRIVEGAFPSDGVENVYKRPKGWSPASEALLKEESEIDFLNTTEEKTNIWKQIMSSLLNEISDVFTEEEVFIIALKNQDKIDQEIAKTLKIKETELIGKIKVILGKYREFINKNINNSLDKYERKLSIK